MVWSRADLKEPAEGLNPVDFGFQLNNDTYMPVWFDGLMLPNSIEVKSLKHERTSNEAAADDVEEHDSLNPEVEYSDDEEQDDEEETD